MQNATHEAPEDHSFAARGIASLVRLLRGTTVTWRTRSPVRISLAPGAHLHAGNVARPIGTSTAILRPHSTISLRAEYPDTAYLVSCRRVLETIRTHFVLELRLQSGWRDNVWPDYLDYYLRTRRWPDSALELGPIFSSVLRRGAGAEQTQHIRTLPWRKRMQRGLARTMLARVGRDPIARGLAHEHWKTLSRTFFLSEQHPAMVAAADLARTLAPMADGCAIIQAGWEADQPVPVMPPALAPAQRISFEGLTSIEAVDGKTQRVATHLTAEAGVLEPGGGLAVRGPVAWEADAAHVCLVGGAKRAYGATMDAPIVCKGTHVQGHAQPIPHPWWRRLQHWQARWRDPEWERPETHDPQHLRVRAAGEEA